MDDHQISQQHIAALDVLHQQYEYNLFALLRPSVSIDGDKYCVLYGGDLQSGTAGFGDTLHLAILDFNAQFHIPARNQKNKP